MQSICIEALYGKTWEMQTSWLVWGNKLAVYQFCKHWNCLTHIYDMKMVASSPEWRNLWSFYPYRNVNKLVLCRKRSCVYVLLMKFPFMVYDCTNEYLHLVFAIIFCFKWTTNSFDDVWHTHPPGRKMFGLNSQLHCFYGIKSIRLKILSLKDVISNWRNGTTTETRRANKKHTTILST